MTPRQIKLWEQLMAYGEKYEISVQLWPEYKTIYIAKDGIDLYSYGSYYLEDTLEEILTYLNRINKQKTTV